MKKIFVPFFLGSLLLAVIQGNCGLICGGKNIMEYIKDLLLPLKNSFFSNRSSKIIPAMRNIPTFTLPHTGDKIPAVAFGSGSKHRLRKWSDPKLSKDTVDETIVRIIMDALKAGFNHLDTAESYLTRIEIGEALKRSGVDRSKLWITDKYNQGWILDDGQVLRSGSPSGPYESLKKGLKMMGLKYVDLFLIHGPYFNPQTCDITLEEAWKQMERIQKEGLARNIGVSNFNASRLRKLYEIADVKPQVDQVEYHLYEQEPDLIEFCKDHDIFVEAYTPLTPMFASKVGENRPLNPIIDKLCYKYHVEPNQLLLRWVYQSGVLPITTSSKLSRMTETFKIFDFELEKTDFDLLQKVGKSFHYRHYFRNIFENDH